MSPFPEHVRDIAQFTQQPNQTNEWTASQVPNCFLTQNSFVFWRYSRRMTSNLNFTATHFQSSKQACHKIGSLKILNCLLLTEPTNTFGTKRLNFWISDEIHHSIDETVYLRVLEYSFPDQEIWICVPSSVKKFKMGSNGLKLSHNERWKESFIWSFLLLLLRKIASLKFFAGCSARSSIPASTLPSLLFIVCSRSLRSQRSKQL